MFSCDIIKAKRLLYPNVLAHDRPDEIFGADYGQMSLTYERGIFMKKEFDLLALGELLLRLSPPNNERISNGEIF